MNSMINSPFIKNSLIVLLVIGFIILACAAEADQKHHCIETGGKWVSGVIGGEYSYFCVPN